MPNLRQNIPNHEVGQVAGFAKGCIGMLLRVFSERFESHDCNAIGFAQMRKPTGVFVKPIEQDIS